MNPIAASFLAAFGLSFITLLFSMRTATTSKSTRRRVDTIQDSFRLSLHAANAATLDILAPRSYSTRLSVFLERFEFVKGIQILLLQAGSSFSVGGGALASACAGAALGTVCLLISGSLWIALAAGAVSAAIPYFILRIQRSRRLKAFNTALPDAIDLLARSLRAGHSVGSSIEMVGEQSREPLASEFAQVFQQQQLGVHFRDAMLHMGDRIPSRDLHFLITAILVQKETGGDLTEILDRAAHVIRERMRIEGEVRTRTAQGKLTGWILSLLPIVMLGLINLVNPGYSDPLFHDATGRMLLYIGGGLIVVGALIIRKIVDVKV